MGEMGVLLLGCCSSGVGAGVADPTRARNELLRRLSEARPKFFPSIGGTTVATAIGPRGEPLPHGMPGVCCLAGRARAGPWKCRLQPDVSSTRPARFADGPAWNRFGSPR